MTHHAAPSPFSRYWYFMPTRMGPGMFGVR